MTKEKYMKVIKKAFTSGINRVELGEIRKYARKHGYGNDIPLEDLRIEWRFGRTTIVKYIGSEYNSDLYSYIFSMPPYRGERLYADIILSEDFIGFPMPCIRFSKFPNAPKYAEVKGNIIDIKGNNKDILCEVLQ